MIARVQKRGDSQLVRKLGSACFIATLNPKPYVVSQMAERCKYVALLNMGGCQNCGPFLGTLNIRCRSMIGIHKKDHNFDNHPYTSLRHCPAFSSHKQDIPTADRQTFKPQVHPQILGLQVPNIIQTTVFGFKP